MLGSEMNGGSCNGGSTQGSANSKVTGIPNPLGRTLGEPHLWQFGSVMG